MDPIVAVASVIAIVAKELRVTDSLTGTSEGGTLVGPPSEVSVGERPFEFEPPLDASTAGTPPFLDEDIVSLGIIASDLTNTHTFGDEVYLVAADVMSEQVAAN